MPNDEQCIALGKLLAAHSLLCNHISFALGYLFRSDQKPVSIPNSVGILVGHLRPFEQAQTALQLLEERCNNGIFSAKTFHDLRDSLQRAMDLSVKDLRLLDVDFDLTPYLERKSEPWSCLNVTLETEEIDRMALEHLEAATALMLAVCCLGADEGRSSVAENSDSPEDVGVSST